MAQSILLVDHDKSSRNYVKDILSSQSFTFLEAQTGKRFLDIVEHNNFNLVLLDPVLPDGCGFDFTEQVRRRTQVPIIVLSACLDFSLKKKGLEKGADYFITKPFTAEELEIHVDAALKRCAQHNLCPEKQRSPLKIKFGSWLLDRSRLQVFDEECRALNLTIDEYKLLEILIITANRVLSREELARHLKDGQIMNNRAIDVKITRLRKKIGDRADPAAYIKTIRGGGYILNCETHIIETFSSSLMAGSVPYKA